MLACSVERARFRLGGPLPADADPVGVLLRSSLLGVRKLDLPARTTWAYLVLAPEGAAFLRVDGLRRRTATGVLVPAFLAAGSAAKE